ncbi:sugar phosphate isomerase/epimerase family protein [Ningiella sp. W23]|uniref:sugar phosphate isomerase/epimerase family protein n=1 Tax=Ningiella sp. W23 TaxID=3023715 RepID=UPI0037581456
MNRRQALSLLGGASLAGLGLGLSASPSFAAMRALSSSDAKPNILNNINIGMHVWVYAKHEPSFDVSNILPTIWSDVKYAGLDGIELMEHPLRREDKTAEMAELIAQHALPLIGTSYGAHFWDASKANEISEDLDNIFTNMQKLGARTIGISVKHPSGRAKTQEEFDAQAELILKAREMGAAKGVVLNLHNHTYEVENNLYDLGNTLKRIPDIKLGPDINWLIRAGVEPNAFLEKYKDNLVFLHLRDQYASGYWAESIGEGDTDFEKIGDTLKRIKFKGDAMIELAHEDGFEPTRPVRESLRMSREVFEASLG